MALGYSSRNGVKPIWIAIHTAEGSTTSTSLFNYFNSSQAGSSHTGIDSAGYPTWLPDSVAAWTMLGGNPYAIQAELCGFARWTRAQWLSTATVDGIRSPRDVLRNTARWIAEVLERNPSIQLRRLTDAQIRGRKETGLLGHGDYSRATGDGDHTDPGASFPWDILIADVQALQAPAAPIEKEEVSPMFQIVQLPASPADGFTKATAVVALPWISKDGSSYTGIKRSSVNIVAGASPVSVFQANWRAADPNRRAVPFDVGTVQAFADSGGRAVPNQVYGVTLEYVAKEPFSLILEVS